MGTICHDKLNLSFSQPHCDSCPPLAVSFSQKIVHVLLRLAVHHKRDRFIKFEMRTTVQSDELLAFRLEFNGHYRTLRSSGDLFSLFAITGNFPSLGIFEDGCVKLDRLFDVIIEPQKWSNFCTLSILCSMMADTRQISQSRDPFGPMVARPKRKYPSAVETNSDHQDCQQGLRRMANHPLQIRLL